MNDDKPAIQQALAEQVVKANQHMARLEIKLYTAISMIEATMVFMNDRTKKIASDWIKEARELMAKGAKS